MVYPNPHQRKRDWLYAAVLGLVFLYLAFGYAWGAAAPSAPPKAASLTVAAFCEYEARLYGFAADMRDHGIPSWATVEYLQQQVQDIPSPPGATAVGRQRAENKLTSIVFAMYAQPFLAPEQAKYEAYLQCTGMRR